MPIVARTAVDQLRSIGEDVSEVLEYVPARFKVIRHVRPKAACTGCHKLVQASAPRAADRTGPGRSGTAGAGDSIEVLRSSAAVSPEPDLCPRWRGFAALHLAEWVRETSIPAEAPGRSSPASYPGRRQPCMRDDTPVPVLSPGKGRTKTGRLWTYVRDERPAQRRCSALGLVCLLTGSKRAAPWPTPGIPIRVRSMRMVMPDLIGCLRRASGLTVACWAHVRRKFYEIHQAQTSPLAADGAGLYPALVPCGECHPGQTAGSSAGVGGEVEPDRSWMSCSSGYNQHSVQVSRKSALAEAIRYALEPLAGLDPISRDDGCMEIDNNAAERALRAVALGRKNYLFVGSDKGGERAAALLQPDRHGQAQTNWIPGRTCAKYSVRSPPIRSTGLTSCCLGTWFRTAH